MTWCEYSYYHLQSGRGLGGGSGRGLGGGSSGGGKVQLYTVEQLVAAMAGQMASLCEHLESTSAFFQVSPASSAGRARHP